MHRQNPRHDGFVDTDRGRAVAKAQETLGVEKILRNRTAGAGVEFALQMFQVGQPARRLRMGFGISGDTDIEVANRLQRLDQLGRRREPVTFVAIVSNRIAAQRHQPPDAGGSEPPRHREYLFAPEIPDPPRRLPHRPLEYTQPPPGGPAQWEAVQSARNRNCAASLEAVARGMKASIDHASLYSQSWFCFNEVHQRPLMDARVKDEREFERLLTHFEGPEEKREDLPDEIKKFPRWYQPAVDGIEHRESVRLKTVTWNDTTEVITLKLDTQYWPAYEIRRTADGWRRIDFGS